MQIRQIQSDALSLCARISGEANRPAILLLHGWPHDSTLYAPVLDRLGEHFFTIAFDLPAIGRSTGLPANAEKTSLAGYLLDAAAALGASRPVVAGIDVGGMIAFAAARDHGSRISGAAIGNTAIPGLDPWRALERDPRIFHFAFHAVPDLPEALVSGRERIYFNFFFDQLGSRQRPLPEAARTAFTAAYERPEALRAGFDWYRAFPADAKHNRDVAEIETSILYFRGDADGRSPDEYLPGLRGAGARSVTGHRLEGTAEFAPIEAPDAFVAMLTGFAERCHEREAAIAL